MVGETEDLIPIKPGYTAETACVACGHTETLEGKLFFQGVHTLAKFSCPACGTGFYRTLPSGHDLLFPSSFSDNGHHLQSDPAARRWLTEPLLRSMFDDEVLEARIEKTVHEAHAEAVILNCLDNRFGHCFAKLWNADILKNKYPGRTIIVFIPAALRWLVPDNIPEVWVFNAPLGQMKRRIVNLHTEVVQAMERFTNVWLSKAYTHLDLAKVDLQKLLRTSPFVLSSYSVLPPVVTFILREDRFWHTTALGYFLFKVAVKFNLPKGLFVWRQNHLVNKTAQRIRKELKTVRIYAAGIGRTGGLASFIDDQRRQRPEISDEHAWCQLYRRSHVVIGVHGSNMIIPTALAAGFVEILPRNKIRHISEDITLNYSGRYMLFLGRHVDQFAGTGLVSRHVISMIRDFPYVYRNTEQGISAIR